MWLLENEEAFEGRRLWLRPGKTYLFGRTAAEPGQLAISHNTISRKHLTITVQSVAEGQTHNLSSRSHIKIEDLATKIGTVVNGQKIKGSVYDTQVEEYEITLGKSPRKFRLKWHPAVFTFSFTTKELQTQPLTSLKERFEQLDIKLQTDYSVKHTTHVISKKRNTAKGLQALINGKYIVTETFLDAVSSVTEPPDAEDGQESSYLERDFDEYWPKAMDHLPPRGSEPIQHPDELYTPNDSRKDVFEGYTFIFYSQLQYDNLMAPITNGGGKAMLHPIEPEETQVDDFVRYVKGVAGEKGAGSFNDGSEGKGVVLVRFLPAKGELVGWYTEFVTAVSLLLDHRPIEQNEFLEAILINDASKLRRPLEVESSNRTQNSPPAEASLQEPMTQQSRAGITESPLLTQSSQQGDSQPIPRRGPRVRKPVKRRFAGFDDDDDEGADEPPPPYEPPKRQTRPQEDEGGLFVSQEQDEPFMPDGHDVDVRSHRKRPPSPIPDSDLMEGMAPSVAKFKRQRLERGDDFAPPSPKPDENVVEPAETKGAKKKAKEELDVLAVVAKNREEAEARARAEAEDLANLPEGIDLAEIRRLNIVEEMDIRIPDRASGKDKEQEIADGRWNSKWNGMKNFKKFRKRGEVVGRQPARVIIALTEVKPKEFGVGDNYWLEDESNDRKKTTSQASAVVASEARTSPFVNAPPTRRGASSARVIASESSDMEEVEAPESEQPSSRATGSRREGTGAPSQKSTRQTQLSSTQTRSGRQGKRAATEPAAAKDPPPPKRTRLATTLLEVGDSDDSDDDLKFRFGKRR